MATEQMFRDMPYKMTVVRKVFPLVFGKWSSIVEALNTKDELRLSRCTIEHAVTYMLCECSSATLSIQYLHDDDEDRFKESFTAVFHYTEIDDVEQLDAFDVEMLRWFFCTITFKIEGKLQDLEENKESE